MYFQIIFICGDIKVLFLLFIVDFATYEICNKDTRVINCWNCLGHHEYIILLSIKLYLTQIKQRNILRVWVKKKSLFLILKRNVDFRESSNTKSKNLLLNSLKEEKKIYENHGPM